MLDKTCFWNGSQLRDVEENLFWLLKQKEWQTDEQTGGGVDQQTHGSTDTHCYTNQI